MTDFNSSPLSRREFLKAGIAGAGSVALLSAVGGASGKGLYGPFKMGVQSYSLRHFPMEDMLAKVRELGLNQLEGWEGHFPITHDPEKLAGYKAALKKAGITVPTFGVVSFGRNTAANREAFAFAQALGVKTLSADPSPDSFDNLEQLTKEFGINIAIHNHGPGARYDKSESVYSALDSHDKRIGACLDAGHLLRSSEDPVAFVRHVGSRLYGCHIKDVKRVDGRDVFVNVGEGRLDTVGLLKALKDVKFKGVLSLEYEEHEEDPMPYMKECLTTIQAAVRKV
jgi:sugar phosphate isomerase/epimerase